MLYGIGQTRQFAVKLAVLSPPHRRSLATGTPMFLHRIEQTAHAAIQRL
jgi:hypothetical protein